MKKTILAFLLLSSCFAGRAERELGPGAVCSTSDGSYSHCVYQGKSYICVAGAGCDQRITCAPVGQ